ncbi:MAG: hypothetical protein EOP32_38680 [Rhodococcus sp. (in: high G+C Gram-positive bacteria)]|nr:MAG: hypothetical protein EOP32_38680 [Rhodococcus sp. (in: high G+C Gram-positive bacteria)]
MTQSNNWHDPDLNMIRDVVAHTSDGCEGCLALGTRWEHLMLCLTCGWRWCFVHDVQICTPYLATGARVVAPSLVPGPSEDVRHGLRIARSQ